jgi:hypothetical protein
MRQRRCVFTSRCLIGLSALALSPMAAQGEPAPAELPTWQAPTLAAQPDFADLLAHPAASLDAWLTAAFVDLQPLDLIPVIAEDANFDTLPGMPFRVGVVRALDQPLDSRTSGLWTTAPDGTRVWRAMLRSPGARAIGVNATSMKLPPGASLSIGSLNPDVPARRFYDRGPAGNGTLYAPVIDGDTACIELIVPAGSSEPASIVITAIDHQYRGMPDRLVGAVRELSCNVDVNCRTPLAQPWMRDCVGRMGFQNGSSSYVCTGALIDENAPSYFPAYFLTANHCISTQTVASTLTVYWFYQTPSCSGAVPSLGSVPATSGGGTLLDNSPTGTGYDHSFMRLNNDARSGQTFAPLGTTTSTPAIGVHHPGGSYKRYAAYNYVSDGARCSTLPNSQFYYLRWFDGRTEGGSSGSPLFNDAGQVIGQLYGSCYFTGADLESCTPVTNVNSVYGRVSGSIATIAPNIVVPTDDSFAPNFTFATAKPLTTGSTTTLQLTSFEDWFYVDINASFSATFRVTFSWVSTADQRLQLYSSSNAQLQSATPNSSGVATLTRSITPGRYYIRVYRDRLKGGSYTLQIPADCGPSLAPCIDGALDSNYVAPSSTQTVATSFGDSTLGQLATANGSELDGAYARVIGSNLYLFFPGNLESNLKKLDIFFDTVSGGQNRLLGTFPVQSSLQRMGATTDTNGLRFDAGFEADFFVSLTGLSTGADYLMFGEYSTITTSGVGSVITSLGTTGAGGNGNFQGGDPNTLGIRAAINNSNTGGVTSGIGASSGAGVTTGMELMIPLASLGNPGCSIKIAAFINGVEHDLVSNQSIAPLPVGTPSLGEPRDVDFAAFEGDQFIALQLATAPTVIQNPASIARCPIAAAVFSFNGSGTGLLTRAWQVESPQGSGNWVTLSGNTFSELSSGLSFQHVGSTSTSLTVSSITLGTHPRTLNFRGVLSNPCGSAASAPATLTYCVADFTCDGARTVDDVFVFIRNFFTNNPRCDVDGVPGVSVDDIFVFINIWFAGC